MDEMHLALLVKDFEPKGTWLLLIILDAALRCAEISYYNKPRR